MTTIANNPKKILDEAFMMNIFEDYRKELPLFILGTDIQEETAGCYLLETRYQGC